MHSFQPRWWFNSFTSSRVLELVPLFHPRRLSAPKNSSSHNATPQFGRPSSFLLAPSVEEGFCLNHRQPIHTLQPGPSQLKPPTHGIDPYPPLPRQSRPSAHRSTSRCPWMTIWRCSATWPAPTAATTRASGWRMERRSPRRAAKEKTQTTSMCANTGVITCEYDRNYGSIQETGSSGSAHKLDYSIASRNAMCYR